MRELLSIVPPGVVVCLIPLCLAPALVWMMSRGRAFADAEGVQHDYVVSAKRSAETVTKHKNIKQNRQIVGWRDALSRGVSRRAQ